jgi:NitT/TauT family transport system ATP-binding protein
MANRRMVTESPADAAPGPGASLAGDVAGEGSVPAEWIRVRNLSKTYPTRHGEVEAVRRASFDVAPGQFVSLVGPSGCGKSTVLKIIAGLEPYEEGEVEIANRPVDAGRRDVGIMFQSPILFPWRTVLDNVLLPMEIFTSDAKKSVPRANDLLEMVGLQGFADKYPFELSGGMQQRVSLARLLVFEPSILLMDEPFAALDEFTRERLNQELIMIHERMNRSVVYVTHNIAEAVFVSDRVVVMKPRPGEILDIIDVDLPRPRTVDVIESPRAAELVTKIRRMLRAS